MTNRKPENVPQTMSPVSKVFLKNETFLKRFLTRFFSRPQDIDDVVQDTYLKVFRAEKDREIRSPKSFIFRVARNAALNELKKKSNLLTSYIEDLDDPDISCNGRPVEDLIAARQKLGLFCQSAMEMPPRCRRVFLMAKVYGLSYKEISSQLGIAVSTVEKHVARGLVISCEYVTRMEEEIVPMSPTGKQNSTDVQNRERSAPIIKLRNP